MVYTDPYEEPLRPRIKNERPPWSFSWPWPFDSEYTGRADWWAEPGLKDPYLQRGIWTGKYYTIREESPYWWDPKVPDGTSLAGPMGQDSRYYRNFAEKTDQVGNFFDFQKKLMKNSAQYRQIAENWELSKEHPGISVNPKLDAIDHYTKWSLGKRDTKSNLYHFGPRFYDKPMNEGCLEKGLCLCKYAIPASFFNTISLIKGGFIPITQSELGFRNYFQEALPRLKYPLIISFTYGFTACLASRVRHVDDAWNWTIAACTVAFVYASLSEHIARSIVALPAAIVIGVFYQYARCMPEGTGIRLIHPETGGYHAKGPFAHEIARLGPVAPLNPDDHRY